MNLPANSPKSQTAQIPAISSDTKKALLNAVLVEFLADNNKAINVIDKCIKMMLSSSGSEAFEKYLKAYFTEEENKWLYGVGIAACSLSFGTTGSGTNGFCLEDLQNSFYKSTKVGTGTTENISTPAQKAAWAVALFIRTNPIEVAYIRNSQIVKSSENGQVV